MKTKKAYRLVYESPKDTEIINILDNIPKTFRSEFVGLAIIAFKSKYQKIKEELLTKEASDNNISEVMNPDLTKIF